MRGLCSVTDRHPQPLHIPVPLADGNDRQQKAKADTDSPVGWVKGTVGIL